RDVLDGVSCESCHGAAADWLEPHKDEAGKELGINRPGYLAALELGKRELNDLETRATACTSCHYITEPRLLSAGHPSGADFDYVAGMSSVRHWESAVPEARLASAFAARLKARGAVPKVRLAKLDPASSDPSGGSEPPRTLSHGAVAETIHAEARWQRAVERRRAAGLGAPAPRPVFAVELAEVSDLDLPPFPQIDDSTSIEDVLLLLRDRLRLLYRSVAPKEGYR
ncbi:MAG: hypothetical protein O7A04_06560, partial [Acidobacteria bacterium]|nr:hypothetical protein [Acidobacteriota bacterium]